MAKNSIELPKMAIVSEKSFNFSETILIERQISDQVRNDNVSSMTENPERTLQSAGAGEGRWVWVCATEAAVEVHRLIAATLLQDVLAE